MCDDDCQADLNKYNLFESKSNKLILAGNFKVQNDQLVHCRIQDNTSMLYHAASKDHNFFVILHKRESQMALTKYLGDATTIPCFAYNSNCLYSMKL